jgi:hypothetical protein
MTTDKKAGCRGIELDALFRQKRFFKTAGPLFAFRPATRAALRQRACYQRGFGEAGAMDSEGNT